MQNKSVRCVLCVETFWIKHCQSPLCVRAKLSTTWLTLFQPSFKLWRDNCNWLFVQGKHFFSQDIYLKWHRFETNTALIVNIMWHKWHIYVGRGQGHLISQLPNCDIRTSVLSILKWYVNVYYYIWIFLQICCNWITYSALLIESKQPTLGSYCDSQLFLLDIILIALMSNIE